MWLPRCALLFCCLVAYADHSIQRPKELDVEIPETLENLEKTFPQGSDWMRLLKAERKSYYKISFLFTLGDRKLPVFFCIRDCETVMQGLVASLIQFKCTKCFRGDLRFKRNTSSKSSKKYVVHLPTPVCSIAQLVERRSSNHETQIRD